MIEIFSALGAMVNADGGAHQHRHRSGRTGGAAQGSTSGGYNAPNNGYKKIAMRLRGRCVQEVGMMRSSSQDDQFHFLAGSCCYF